MHSLLTAHIEEHHPGIHPHFVKDLGLFHNNISLPLNKTCPARQLTVSNKRLSQNGTKAAERHSGKSRNPGL